MAMPAAFDSLVDFDGMWTTKLADRYLPLLDLPGMRYECAEVELLKLVDGKYEALTGAAGGREFVTSEPFEMFTPRDLVP